MPTENTLQNNLTSLEGRVICGNCLDVLKELPANSVDAIVTDPP